MRAVISSIAVVGALAVLATAADAQNSPATNPSQKRQQKSATAQNKNEALALFRRGNALVKELLFAEAAEKYKQALELYEHPVTYFNLAIAQINLGQALDAYHSLERAMEQGPAPLGPDKYQQAESRRNALARQLAHLEVICDIEGAEVTIDGAPIFVGPGRLTRVLSPGLHQIVAKKSDYQTTDRQIVLAPGDSESIAMHLLRLDALTVPKRLMRWWIPWVIIGASAVTVAGAGYLDAKSSDNLEAYDRAFQERCPRFGCADSQIPDLERNRQRAENQQLGARMLYAIGLPALTTGAVLLYLNRERLVRRDPPSSTPLDATRWRVEPAWSPDAMGVRLRGHF